MSGGGFNPFRWGKAAGPPGREGHGEGGNNTDGINQRSVAWAEEDYDFVADDGVPRGYGQRIPRNDYDIQGDLDGEDYELRRQAIFLPDGNSHLSSDVDGTRPMWSEVNNPGGGRHGQQGIPHNMGEAPGQWQGLPRHQNDTAQPAFQGQTPAGINNAGAGPQGQEAPIGAGIQPGGLAGMANAPTRQGLPRHQNDTAPPAFQGQAPAGINNAGAGHKGRRHK